MEQIFIIKAEPELDFENLRALAFDDEVIDYSPDYDDIIYFAYTFQINLLDMYEWLARYLTFLKRNRDALTTEEIVIFGKLIHLIYLEQHPDQSFQLQENA